MQKLTELGVDRIVPFVAERSVVRWDADKADRNVERLRRVAREAAMQSRRTWLPEVADGRDLRRGARPCPARSRAERGGAPPDARPPDAADRPRGRLVRRRARPAARPRSALGPSVLRAETAAITGAALLVRAAVGARRPGVTSAWADGVRTRAGSLSRYGDAG